MNKVILMGNVTRDVQLKDTNSGKSYTRVGLAVDRRFSKNKEVDFFNLLAWDKTAEFMGKWTPKGTRVLVEGRLQTSKYKDKDGNERSSVEVVVENIEFAGGKKDSDNRKPSDSFDGETVEPDDIPF